MDLLPPEIDEISNVCIGELKGTAKRIDLSNVQDGSIVVIYEAPLSIGSIPVASAIVQNGQWQINDKNIIDGGKKYCGFTIETNLLV